jgi:hypothetical protein
MKFLKMAIDKSDNITLSLYEVDSEVCLRKSHNGKQEMYKRYQSLSDAMKAFDKEVVRDYHARGVYYGDFYTEGE